MLKHLCAFDTLNADETAWIMTLMPWSDVLLLCRSMSFGSSRLRATAVAMAQRRLANPATGAELCRVMRRGCALTDANWAAVAGLGGIVAGGQGLRALAAETETWADSDVDIFTLAKKHATINRPSEADLYEAVVPSFGCVDRSSDLWSQSPDVAALKARFGETKLYNALGSAAAFPGGRELIRRVFDAGSRQVIALDPDAAAHAAALAGFDSPTMQAVVRATFDFPLAAVLVCGVHADEDEDASAVARGWGESLRWAGGPARVASDLIHRRLTNEPLRRATMQWTTPKRVAKWRGRGWSVVLRREPWLHEVVRRCDAALSVAGPIAGCTRKAKLVVGECEVAARAVFRLLEGALLGADEFVETGCPVARMALGIRKDHAAASHTTLLRQGRDATRYAFAVALRALRDAAELALARC